MNSEKWKNTGKTTMYGEIRYSDVDAAILHILAFSNKYAEVDLSDLLEIIEAYHKHANDGGTNIIAWDNDVPRMADFSELPSTIWNKVRTYVEECNAKGITPDSAHSIIFDP